MSETLRLDQACSVIMGQAPKGDAYNNSGDGWPLIAGAGDFQEGRPAPKKYTTEAPKLSQAGDIILGIRASIGAKVLADGDYCLGRGVAALRPGPGLDARFLWHWLTFSASTLAAKGKGATFKQVNRQDIGEMMLPLPSLPEQKKIAQVLDRVDALRAARLKTLSLLDDLAQSIFLNMFEEELQQQTSPLGKHLSFVTSGGRGWAKYYSPTGERFIRSLDVQMNYINTSESEFVKAPDNAEARRTRVQQGDVLLTITGSRIGRVSALPDALAGSYVSQHVAILRPDPEVLRSRYLAYYLSLPSGGQRQISHMQYGQTKPGLNFDQIREFSVPAPPLDSQDEFLRRVTRIEELRSKYSHHIAEFDSLSASLQHRAFKGEPFTNGPLSAA